MHWPAIVFGWPAALAAIVVSAAGLLLQRRMLVAAGAVAALPFMSYLFATPRFWILAAIAAPCHFAAAAVMPRRPLLACTLFLPTPLFTWWVATVITRG